jgi:[ribosomal protein S5]-alanine N-acetyltransferase
MKSRVHETARLRIEPFGEAHLSERYVGWLADPEVVRWSEQRFRTHTLASCRAYAASFEGTPNMLFALVAQDPNVGHLGNLNVYVDPRHGVADIGIMVGDRAAWGQGYGREAWAAIMRALLDEPGIRKVTGGCVTNNVAMVKIMQTCGMMQDGRRLKQYVYDGQAVDAVYFAAFGNRPFEAP